MDIRLPNVLGQWTLDTKVASRGSLDHRVLLGRPNPENEPFFILDILVLLRTTVNRVFGGESECKLQATEDPLLAPCSNPQFTTALSHSYHCWNVSLHYSFPAPFLHISHLSISYLFIRVALETAMCQTAYIFFV